MMKDQIIRQSIRFYGRVQGVGFRYRAKQAAESLGLTGWVRNEYDGCVSMEVQGTQEKIERMLAYIDAGSWIHIEEIKKQPLALVEHEYRFSVKGY